MHLIPLDRPSESMQSFAAATIWSSCCEKRTAGLLRTSSSDAAVQVRSSDQTNLGGVNTEFTVDRLRETVKKSPRKGDLALSHTVRDHIIFYGTRRRLYQHARCTVLRAHTHTDTLYNIYTYHIYVYIFLCIIWIVSFLSGPI